MCEIHLAGESATGYASQPLQSLIQVLIEDDIVEQAALIYATGRAHSRWDSLPCCRSMGEGGRLGPHLCISFSAVARRCWSCSSLSVPRPRSRRSSSSSDGGAMNTKIAFRELART